MSEKLLTPKSPDPKWLNSYFSPSLVAAKEYFIDTPPNVSIKLDQNETPWDWPVELKNKVLERVRQRAWQRYPSSFTPEINAAIAAATGVPAECIITTNGSNLLVSLIMSTLTQRIRGKVVIARPSFALYESHCQYEGISYEVWPLNDQLDYDLSLLPKLTEGSLVVFASPNNPVGNALSYDIFDRLLTENPTTFFLADEAYFEFVDQPYTDLLARHANLILARTFSKTMGAAGVRIGYAIASAPLIRELGKLRLPYLLNFFAVEAALEVLRNPEFEIQRTRAVDFILRERRKLSDGLKLIAGNSFVVKDSHANFLLLRWNRPTDCKTVYDGLVQRGILVRNVSGAPGLSGCLRVTIGSEQENQAFAAAMQSIVAG